MHAREIFFQGVMRALEKSAQMAMPLPTVGAVSTGAASTGAASMVRNTAMQNTMPRARTGMPVLGSTARGLGGTLSRPTATTGLGMGSGRPPAGPAGSVLG